jgi:hypothetical protein
MLSKKKLMPLVELILRTLNGATNNPFHQSAATSIEQDAETPDHI